MKKYNLKVTISLADSYQLYFSSCNSEVPVSFANNQPFDSSGKELVVYMLDTDESNCVNINIYSDTDKPSKLDENPIKLVISEITCDQGEFMGNSAVLYGYFSGDNAEKLEFYLNEEQSKSEFQYGENGIEVTIDNSGPSISLK